MVIGKLECLCLFDNIFHVFFFQKFDFLPNQRLNFLVGENGSGKSAILAAITFALGGSAKITNRGSSNKSFIRTGEPSATVEIKLCNVGEKSFKVR